MGPTPPSLLWLAEMEWGELSAVHAVIDCPFDAPCVYDTTILLLVAEDRVTEVGGAGTAHVVIELEGAEADEVPTPLVQVTVKV